MQRKLTGILKPGKQREARFFFHSRAGTKPSSFILDQFDGHFSRHIF
jgi:hypothetical protein